MPLHLKVVYLWIREKEKENSFWKREKKNGRLFLRDTLLFYVHMYPNQTCFCCCSCRRHCCCYCVWCALYLCSFVSVWCVGVIVHSFSSRHECECVSSNICFHTLYEQIPSPLPHRKQIRHKYKLVIPLKLSSFNFFVVVICLFVFGCFFFSLPSLLLLLIFIFLHFSFEFAKAHQSVRKELQALYFCFMKC